MTFQETKSKKWTALLQCIDLAVQHTGYAFAENLIMCEVTQGIPSLPKLINFGNYRVARPPKTLFIA